MILAKLKVLLEEVPAHGDQIAAQEIAELDFFMVGRIHQPFRTGISVNQ